jgi:Aminomethyltransferase folate-binding domain
MKGDGSMAGRVNAHPGILLYTRIKKSPYYYAARRHRVRLYSVYNHHYHPRLYRDPIEEYWQLLEGVTVWDVGGAERQVEISGPDAFRFTNMLTPRNLARCAVGQCKYAFITDERGGIINDPVLLRLGEIHFWLSLADSDVLLWAKGRGLSRGDASDDHRAGCRPAPDPGTEIEGGHDRPVRCRPPRAPLLPSGGARARRMRIVISRTGYSGELGYELYLHEASRDGVKLWYAVIQAGEPYGLAPDGRVPAIDLARRVASASVAQTIRVWSSGTVSSQAPRRFISTHTVISTTRTPESEREQTADTSPPRLNWFEAILVLNRLERIGGRRPLGRCRKHGRDDVHESGAGGRTRPMRGLSPCREIRLQRRLFDL